MRTVLTSKRLFMFNIIFASVFAGFLLSFVVFSCSTPFSPERAVFAQDSAPMVAPRAEELQSSFNSVAAAVLPSVLELRITVGSAGSDSTQLPFEFFFERPEDTPRTQQPRNSGLGSAVIVARQDQKYYAITNDHVAGSADEIIVVLYDGTEFEGTLEGADSRMDIAVVSFYSDDPDIPLAAYGDSDALLVGDWVLAVGNPFGFASSVTAGIVSAKGRAGPVGNISDFIQTDAAINQGNSGGPLVNLRGEIVGINTWISTPSGINVGLGFATPINNVKKAVADIVSGGEVRYGWLGVEIADLEGDEAGELRFVGRSGVLIRQVFNSSPAEVAGLLPGDIVIDIDGVPVTDFRHLSRIVGSVPVDEIAEFRIYRGAEEILMDVTMGLRGSDEEIQSAYRDMWPGFSVLRIDDESREQHGFDSTGFMIQDVRSGGIPQVAGMQRGDFVISINGAEVKNLLDFYRLLNDTETEEFDFLLNRSGEEITIGIIRQ
jgi:Do/DeqQ family serine protease